MAFIDSTSKPGKHLVGWRNLAGKQRWQTCKTLAVARQLVRAVEDSLALGRDWDPKATRGEADLIEEVAAMYLEEIAPRRAASTVVRYALHLSVFEKFLRDDVQARGKLGISLLTKDTLIGFSTWLRRPENGLHKRKRSDDTVLKLVETVEVFWQWAYERERWADLPSPRKLHLERAPKKAPRAPTWPEMDAAVRAATGWQKQFMTWLRFTGMRPTETWNLLWADIDMQAGTLSIRSDLLGNKTRVERTIPLSDHLLTEIAGWGRREGYVISQGHSRKLERGIFRRADDLRRTWRRAGVPEQMWNRQPAKAFRVGIKTQLLALGAMREAVNALQGHIDSNASARYVDPSHLPLKATAALIPPIGSAGHVIQLPRKHPRRDAAKIPAHSALTEHRAP